MAKESLSPVQLRQTRPGLTSQIKSFFICHLQVFFSTLGQLSRTPFASLMTSAALGIALALPAGMHVLLQHGKQFGGDIRTINQISLYLRKDTTESQIKTLVKTLQQDNHIAVVTHIPKAKALEEFQQHSGFGEALTALDTNPLPDVLTVQPALAFDDATQIPVLVGKLQRLPQVEIAQADIHWLQRLYALIHIAQRGVFILGVLLGLAVLLIIGNTIRLAIENRRSEIVVIKLIGGTDTFIRRPFLYTGMWYGLSGSLIAIFLVNMALVLVRQPLAHFTSLYSSRLFDLGLMSFTASMILIFSGCVLGLTGAWLAVGRHLRDIEPK